MQITHMQKDFQIKKLGECHDFYVQSNRLLLADVFENYMNFIIVYHFYLKNESGKVEKLVANLHDKTENLIHIKNLNQVLNHRFVFEKSS